MEVEGLELGLQFSVFAPSLFSTSRRSKRVQGIVKGDA